MTVVRLSPVVRVAEEQIGNRVPRYLAFLGSNLHSPRQFGPRLSVSILWFRHVLRSFPGHSKQYPKAFWHDLCSLSMMTHNQAIDLCLDAILSSGPEYLRMLKSDQAPSASGDNGSHKKRVQSPHEPRKKLIDAATRLIQLLTGPEEYLDRLANSVSSHNDLWIKK